MININNKFKEISPEITIQNIQNFFKAKKCQIQVTNKIQNISSTYSVSLELFFNDQMILRSNGKGTTELFALASGYAELYERFCATITCFGRNPLNYISFYNKKKNINLKKITLEKVLNNSYYQKFFESYLPELNEVYYNKFITTCYNGAIYEEPYYTLDNQNTYYLSPMITASIIDSTGLATGNTIEEALVQGSSEIYERYCLTQFYQYPQLKYYFLDINQLPDYLKQIINNIEKLNYKITIYDLSYNFKVPVCMVLIQDIINHELYISFGSHPCGYIAIERCLTEIYQGFFNLPKSNNLFNTYNNINLKQFIKESYCTTHRRTEFFIPEFLINNSYKINTLNKNFFINDIEFQDNYILLNEIIRINKLNNFNFIYHDLSLDNNIFTVHIIPMHLLKIPTINHNYFYQNNLTINEKEYCFNIFLDIIKLLKDYIFTIDSSKTLLNYDKIYNFLFQKNIELQYTAKMYQKNPEEYYMTIFKLIECDIWNPTMCINDNFMLNNYILFKDLLNNINFNSITFSNFNSSLLSEIKYLKLYLNYINNNYNLEDIKKYFKFLGYNNINIDIEKNLTNKTIIKFLFINTLKQKYTSLKYSDFIQLFLKNKN